ncbi:MAG TPA: type 2 isopentenyl-diphosphate Delta-isomerase, partial [Bacteroidota bacterium]
YLDSRSAFLYYSSKLREHVLGKKTSSRKQEHVQLTVTRDVGFRNKTSGFERWEFLHNALPELNYRDVDPSAMFLGKPMSLPLIISSMTGGYADAARINRQLAEVCSEKKIGMGVGSQRQALESKEFHRSYAIVREQAPGIPIIGNIGAAEVARLNDVSPILKLIDMIRADAFAVHLNPLQELLQPEGSPEFTGVLRGIEMLVKNAPVPVIVKEIGAGISANVARRLLAVGVSIIDVAGAGGTSWAGVEILRRNGTTTKRVKEESATLTAHFWDWGIPTVDALRQVCSLKNQHPSLRVIASGGIRHGLDIAKSIAFGADVAGMARPLLKALEAGGKEGLKRRLEAIETELKSAMFLTGSKTLQDLQGQQLMLSQ